MTRIKVGIIVIPAVKAKFSTTASSKVVSPNKCDDGGQPEINMATETGNANISGTVRDRIEIPTANQGFFDYSELNEAVYRRLILRSAIDTVNGNDSQKRKYLYSDSTVMMEIPTANLSYSIAARSKIVCPGDCDNNRQLEITIISPKPEIYLEL